MTSTRSILAKLGMTTRKMVWPNALSPAHYMKVIGRSMTAFSSQLVPSLTTALVVVISTALVAYFLLRKTDRGETAELLRNPITMQLNNSYLNAPRLFKSKRPWELDMAKMVSHSTCKISPANLVLRCKEVLKNKVGLDREEDLHIDFVYSRCVCASVCLCASLCAFLCLCLTLALTLLTRLQSRAGVRQGALP